MCPLIVDQFCFKVIVYMVYTEPVVGRELRQQIAGSSARQQADQAARQTAGKFLINKIAFS